MHSQLTRILALTAVLSATLIAGASPGEELWSANCKKCHGDDGKGETAMGKRFAIRDYTDAAVQESMTDEAIRDAIVDGKKNEDGKRTMLAFGNKLSDEEVDTLVAYVRSLQAE
jgi:mono/diheme cytochrome c family protein